MSDPDQHHARAALAKLEHLVVQDIFLTETAWHADVVLPASAHAEKLGTFSNTNRQVQIGRPVLPLPGDARQDLDLLVQLANRVGLDWTYDGAPEVYEEMRQVMKSLDYIPWQRLEANESVTYPSLRRRHGEMGRLRRALSHRRWSRAHRAGRPARAGRSAGRRLSHGADDGPRAGALAHRRHDAPRRGAGPDRTRRLRRHEPARDREARLRSRAK